MNSSLHYAVSPKLTEAPELLRGPAINYAFQGIGCYLRNFSASLFEEDKAVLDLEIGTLFNIERIVFEKYSNGQYISINTTDPSEALNYTFIDTQLQEGINTYRVLLRLKNGDVQYSNEQTLFYVPPKTYRLFPNPIRSGEDLFILSGSGNSSENVLYLFDGTGRQVSVFPLETTSEFYTMDHLPEGIYFYQIRQDGQQLQTGKIVVVREWIAKTRLSKKIVLCQV